MNKTWFHVVEDTVSREYGSKYLSNGREMCNFNIIYSNGGLVIMGDKQKAL